MSDMTNEAKVGDGPLCDQMQVLTAAVKKRDVVGLLRGLERHGEDNIWRVAQEAREEVETLRTQLAHWKVFGEHAESERSRLQGEVMRLSHELARLRHD